VKIIIQSIAILYAVGLSTSAYTAQSQTTRQIIAPASSRVVTTKDGTKLNIVSGQKVCARTGGKCGFQLPPLFTEKKIRILIEYDDGTFEQSTIEVNRVKNSGTIIYVTDPAPYQRQKPRKVKHIYTQGDDGVWRV
jgi:hypothetical protein